MKRITIIIVLGTLGLAAILLWPSDRGGELGTSVPKISQSALPKITLAPSGSTVFESIPTIASTPGIRRSRMTPTAASELPAAQAAEVTPTATPTITPDERLPSPTRLVEEVAELQALRELQNIAERAPQDGRIGGIRSGNGNSSRLLPSPTPSATPSETPLQRVGGQTRGYAMLYMMQPQARVSVNKQIDTLLRAEINEIYLGVLTDGTFSRDFTFLNESLKRLSVGGRAVTLMVYLTNGATQRDWQTTAIDVAFNTIDPFIFRELIQHDFPTRDLFTRLIRAVKPSLELNRSLSPRAVNLAAVMLEDNLDAASYGAMRKMAQTELGDLADLIRNPCPGCYEGNDQSTQGEGLEMHSPQLLSSLSSDDGFTLDGVSFRFPGEAPNGAPGVEEVKAMLQMALERRLRYFGLWRAERQGRLAGGRIDHPEDRIYEVPTEAQIAVEIELLRHGLTPIGAE